MVNAFDPFELLIGDVFRWLLLLFLFLLFSIRVRGSFFLLFHLIFIFGNLPISALRLKDKLFRRIGDVPRLDIVLLDLLLPPWQRCLLALLPVQVCGHVALSQAVVSTVLIRLSIKTIDESKIIEILATHEVALMTEWDNMELFVDKTNASLVLMVVIKHVQNGCDKGLIEVVSEATSAHNTVHAPKQLLLPRMRT